MATANKSLHLIREIPISKSSFVKITVSFWNDEVGVDIRVYLEGPNYQGPTKSGIRIHKKGFKRLNGLLQEFFSKSQDIDDQVIGRAPKDFDRDVCISISRFSGAPKLNMREVITSCDKEIYTKKGFCLPLTLVSELLEGMSEAEWYLENIS